MKVLNQNRKTGEISLYLESLDDLWHLKNIAIPGDLVWADTYRRKEEKSDKIRAERPEKKRMRLGIRVERVEFQEFQDKIRILGKIEEGPQDLGQHHTLLLGPGNRLAIIKEEWKKHELDRIMSAVEETRRPSIYFISLDDTEASVFVMNQYAVRELGSIFRTGTGKMYESKDNQQHYFKEIIQILKSSIENEPLVILGPGFAKERFVSYLKDEEPALSGRAATAASGQTGATGVYEIIKKGLGGKILEESRVVIETKLMEEVLERISKGKAVAYGPKQIEAAVASGAVELLLLTDDEVRTDRGEEIMRKTENLGGKVEILSTTHEAGKRLVSLGGYAALLRYDIEFM